MRMTKWTLGLAALGLISLPAFVQAEEKLSPVQSLVSGTTLGGYVSSSAQWNLGTGNKNLPGYGIGQANNAAKADGFNLDAVSVSLEKPLDATDNWASGYKVEFVTGQDAQDWSGVKNGVKQAYAALRAPIGNGIDFKMGQFDTVIGYESFNAGANPNYTRSYGWAMEPTTHQGLLASYQVNKMVGIAAGVANTWGGSPVGRAGVAGNTASESFKSYMGALTLTAPESMGFLAGSTLYLGAVTGFDNSSVQNANSYYVGGTMNTPIKALKVGAAFDYKDLNDHSPVKGAGEGAGAKGARSQQALAGYLSYQLTEKLSVHSRTEYAWNDIGLADAVTAQAGNDTATLAGAGNYSKVFAQTATLQYDLWKNVITRGEFRWDHSLDDANRYGSTTTTANRGNAYLLALNVIYKF